jgi:hypothetical protein
MSHLFAHRLLACTLAAALAGATTLASAQGAAPAATPTQKFEQRFENRQQRQEQRIDQGVASGALTPHETRRLGRQQAGLVRAEARAEADGKITRGEAAAIDKRQDHASRTIYRQKHDGQVAK